MARKPASPSSEFDTLRVPKGARSAVAFPDAQAGEIMKLIRNEDSPLRAQLNKLLNTKPGEQVPGEMIASNLRYLRGAKSGGDKSVGLVVVNAPHKEMPVTVLGTLTYGEFSHIRSKGSTPLSAVVNELLDMYPNREKTGKSAAAKAPAETRELRVPKGYKIFAPVSN